MFRLGPVDHLVTQAAALFDVGLRTAAACVVFASNARNLRNVAELVRDLDDAERYTALLEAGRAQKLYDPATYDVRFQESRPHSAHYRPSTGYCVDLAWRTPFETYSPRLRDRYRKHAKNLVARARHFRHDGEARPTIVLLHGFATQSNRFNERFFQLRWLYEKLGLDVVSCVLPFHGPRRTEGSAHTGQLFFSEGMCWTAEAFRHAVQDLRILRHYLEHERGVPVVGVSGMSLGGYTTALLASVEPRLAFAIPSVPLVSLPDAMLGWPPASLLIKAGMLLMNVSVEDIRHRMAVHSPLSFQPAIPRERLMIIAGVGDRLVPPKHASVLWEHWGRPAIHWFPGNHLIHFGQGEYLRHVARFLVGIDFLPERTP